MLNQDSIQQIVDNLAKAASAPSKVILIGSYARGQATEHSDLDLIVLQKQFSNKADEYRKLIAQVHKITSNVDLILMREDDFELKSLVGGTLPFWAKQEGQVLHDFT
jgi:uncharacterized protein